MDLEPLPITCLDDFRIEHTGRHCRHRAKRLDPSVRTVSCSECGAVLDPFDSLMDIARDHVNQRAAREVLARDKQRLQGQLAELKREVGSAKARKRRLAPPTLRSV